MARVRERTSRCVWTAIPSAYAATFDARLSLRLRADDAMDLQSLWADVTGYGAETSNITWTTADGEMSNDLWVHFDTQDGWIYDDLIEALVGAVTLSGDPIASDYVRFLVESEIDASNGNADSGEMLWQPDTGDNTLGHVTVIAGDQTGAVDQVVWIRD